MSLIGKEVVVYDVYEGTYRRGVVIEDGLFLTIEVQPTISRPTKRKYTYPLRDINNDEFLVYVREV